MVDTNQGTLVLSNFIKSRTCNRNMLRSTWHITEGLFAQEVTHGEQSACVACLFCALLYAPNIYVCFLHWKYDGLFMTWRIFSEDTYLFGKQFRWLTVLSRVFGIRDSKGSTAGKGRFRSILFIRHWWTLNSLPHVTHICHLLRCVMHIYVVAIVRYKL